MAMASLCASLKKKYGLEDNIRRFKFHAFIVDHGVRPNSLKEAKWVQRELFSWGRYTIPPDASRLLAHTS